MCQWLRFPVKYCIIGIERAPLQRFALSTGFFITRFQVLAEDGSFFYFDIKSRMETSNINIAIKRDSFSYIVMFPPPFWGEDNPLLRCHAKYIIV